MAYQVKILPAALEDAKDHYHYIAADSPDNALIWFNGLFDAVDSLATMPKRCPVAPETTIVGSEIRVLLYRKHYRILYAIDKDIVRIYHIHHCARQLLTKEEFFVQPELSGE